MSAALVLGALWVVAAAAVAMMPMRLQIVPGVALLAAAPVLLVWMWQAHGWIWLAFGLFAFASMMRNPLIHLFRRLTPGHPKAPPGEGGA